MKRNNKIINYEISNMTLKEFQSYLAGIIDSTLIIKTTFKSNILIIRFKIEDLNHLKDIQNKLKILIPKIKISSKIISRVKNYIDLDIYDLNEMQYIINLLKNKILSKEIDKINYLIKNINKSGLNLEYLKNPLLNESIKPYNIKEYILNSNWLRGFISNKGNLYIKYIKEVNKIELMYKLVLSKLNGKYFKFNNEKLIYLLEEIFQGEIYIYKNKYILLISNKKGLYKILNYLEKYPILNESSKKRFIKLKKLLKMNNFIIPYPT